MTEVLHSPSSSSSRSISTPTHNATLFQTYVGDEVVAGLAGNNNIEEEEEDNRAAREKRENERREQLSLLAILVTLFRKSFWVACKTESADFSGASGSGGGGRVMEIGWPTDVHHVNHVTFDRFNGFLGLPVEFEPEVSRRAPSASATVFGVSTESMQLSYDPRGNSIPTILLLMQRHLYSQGGLQAEGIFRITAGNSQEEYVRDQLNRGVIPEGVDVHCLAGLIKVIAKISHRFIPGYIPLYKAAWFRELPRGVLDSLSPEQVMQCQSEEDCDALVRLLPSTEASLLDWAINLMADVVLEECLNKMNARNIAMVFAPNMTQMADPLTALMYAVQVMNFLKTLIEKTLQEREDSVIEPAPTSGGEPSDDNGNQSSSILGHENPATPNEEAIQEFLAEDISDEDYLSYSTSTEESDDNVSCETPDQVYRVSGAKEALLINDLQNHIEENKMSKTGSQSSNSNLRKPESRIDSLQAVDLSIKTDYKNKGISNLSRINSIIERFEAWR